MKPWWPQIRAGLVALAIAVGLLDGCPMPSGSEEKRYLKEYLGPQPAAAVDAADRVRVRLLQPFRIIGDLGNLRQRWILFSGAPRKRYRMWIDARTGPDEAWETLYRAQDDDHAFLDDQLSYRRIRGAWSPRGSGGPRGAYPSFATWIAREIFARDARYREVRVQMEQFEIAEGGGARGTGVFVYPLLRSREETQ